MKTNIDAVIFAGVQKRKDGLYHAKLRIPAGIKNNVFLSTDYFVNRETATPDPDFRGKEKYLYKYQNYRTAPPEIRGKEIQYMIKDSGKNQNTGILRCTNICTQGYRDQREGGKG